MREGIGMLGPGCGPSWSPRSRSSRSAATASTRRSTSATSSSTKAIGVDLDIKPGVGPVAERPIRTRADLAQLRDLTPEDVPYVTEAIGLLTRELGATPSSASPVPPSPSPATSSRAARPAHVRNNAKAMMYGDPERPGPTS
ncbi:Uroporphyrinogen decarboxylase OS=Streptomyces violarus OX=67380 GN=hemE PE=3 SV=1 [Streptomyces violarus]